MRNLLLKRGLAFNIQLSENTILKYIHYFSIEKEKINYYQISCKLLNCKIKWLLTICVLLLRADLGLIRGILIFNLSLELNICVMDKKLTSN